MLAKWWNLMLWVYNAFLNYNTLDILLFLTEIKKQPPEVFCEKKVFLEIWQNSQENTCARVSGTGVFL